MATTAADDCAKVARSDPWSIIREAYRRPPTVLAVQTGEGCAPDARSGGPTGSHLTDLGVYPGCNRYNQGNAATSGNALALQN